MTIETEVIETSPQEEEAPEAPQFSEEEAEVIQAEVDRRETVIHDLVNNAVDGKAADFMSVFDTEIKHRLHDIIAQDKVDVQAAMLSEPPTETQEESQLGKDIEEMHAKVSDEEWETVPDTSKQEDNT